MNEIIYNGLRLVSNNGCKYYNIVEGDTISLMDDKATSTLTLTYTPGCTSEDVANFLGISRVGKSREIEPTLKVRRFKPVYVTLNGLKLQKLTADTHIIRVVIVSDSESRVIQSERSTTIVISAEDKDNQEFVKFLFYSGNLAYLRPVGPKPKCWSFKNFPSITVKDSDVVLESESDYAYTLRRRYNDYVIREIDYIDQLILELRRILDNYGVELVRWNKEETLRETSYIVYQINQTPSKIHHPNYSDREDTIVSYRLPIDFTLRTPDMVLFYDFKNKYNNVDLLTNFCEFKTTDKYGQRWTAAIKWQGITEEFNHVYQSDDNSNFGNQCQFRCELYFYEVLDERYKFLDEIVLELDAQDSDRKTQAEEEKHIKGKTEAS